MWRVEVHVLNSVFILGKEDNKIWSVTALMTAALQGLPPEEWLVFSFPCTIPGGGGVKADQTKTKNDMVSSFNDGFGKEWVN